MLKNRFALRKRALTPFIEQCRKRRNRLLQRLGTAWMSAYHSKQSERDGTCNCCRTTSTLATYLQASEESGRRKDLMRFKEEQSRKGAGACAWSNISISSSCARNDVDDTRKIAEQHESVTQTFNCGSGESVSWEMSSRARGQQRTLRAPASHVCSKRLHALF